MVDGHSDITPYFEDATWDFTRRHSATETHMDLPRIREGGLDAQFFSIYLGREAAGADDRFLVPALRRIAAVRALAERVPEVVLATRAEDVRLAASRGQLAALMGAEGGHLIDDSAASLRAFYALGVRYLTLTHSFHTPWADSSGTTKAPAPLHGGLTERGRAIVREMNRLGMMVDVSHVSDDTFWDALEVSRAPVIASHSSVRALSGHIRNLSDPMLAALGERGGLVMINFYPGYLDADAAEQTREYMTKHRAAFAELQDLHGDDARALRRARRSYLARHPAPSVPLSVVIDHIDHAIRVAGVDHVGLGADWDGVPSMPLGLEDVSRLPSLTRGLVEGGHSAVTIKKVLGGNLLRVMREVERVSEIEAGRAR